MEDFEFEYSDQFREARLVAQMSPRQRALWYVERDARMFGDLRIGRKDPGEFALWVIEGTDWIE